MEDGETALWRDTCRQEEVKEKAGNTDKRKSKHIEERVRMMRVRERAQKKRSRAGTELMKGTERTRMRRRESLSHHYLMAVGQRRNLIQIQTNKVHLCSLYNMLEFTVTV